MVWQSDSKRHNEVVRCVLLFEELLGFNDINAN